MPNLVEATQEKQALLANDIKVLTGQLNEALRKSAAHGLRVEITVAGVLETNPAIYFQELSVRMFSEVL